MGLNFSGVSTCQRGTSVVPAGQPNPRRYTIQALQQVQNQVVVKLCYAGVTNYEGVKILLYVNTTVATIVKSSALDPHFSDDGSIAPFARFEPTDTGWAAAVALAFLLSSC